MNTNKKIYVYFHHNREIPELFGVLSVQVIRGKELVSFEFDKYW